MSHLHGDRIRTDCGLDSAPRPSLTQMPVAIARARPDETDLVVGLGRSTYSSHFGSIWAPPSLVRYLDEQFALEAVAAELRTDFVRYYFVRQSGRPVGFAKVRLDQPLTAPVQDASSSLRPRGRGMELEKIYFHESATGCGFGGALLRYIIALARAERQECIWLDVLRINVAARRLYERHGFRVVGDMPFTTDLGEIGLWVMMRRA